MSIATLSCDRVCSDGQWRIQIETVCGANRCQRCR